MGPHSLYCGKWRKISKSHRVPDLGPTMPNIELVRVIFIYYNVFNFMFLDQFLYRAITHTHRNTHTHGNTHTHTHTHTHAYTHTHTRTHTLTHTHTRAHTHTHTQTHTDAHKDSDEYEYTHVHTHTHTHTHTDAHKDSDEYSIVAFCKNANNNETEQRPIKLKTNLSSLS